MNAAQAYEDRLAWVKERAARAVSAVSISAPVPSVIERISSPVISPQALAAPIDLVNPVDPVVSVLKTAVHVGVPFETVDSNPLPAKDAQFVALQRMGLIGLKSRADDIFLIIATACRAGVDDLTGREIQALYERRYGRRIESGTISARVSELLAARRILRRPQSRVCTVTREMAAPVYVVMKQVRMEY
jgi:hypothetical protein